MDGTHTQHARQFEGTVVSTSMEKTCVVLVEGWKRHPKYQKAYRTRRRYKVHDPERVAQVGTTVRFEECRPISKEKRWRLVRSAATGSVQAV